MLHTKRQVAAAAGAVTLGLAASTNPAAAAYIGEGGSFTCNNNLRTGVRASVDHQHRVNATRKSYVFQDSTIHATAVIWQGSTSGTWATGTNNGSYSYEGSGAECYTEK